ncbi:hypothetical protein MCOR12_007182, partial [Pyricularia oryzae]
VDIPTPVVRTSRSLEGDYPTRRSHSRLTTEPVFLPFPNQNARKCNCAHSPKLLSPRQPTKSFTNTPSVIVVAALAHPLQAQVQIQLDRDYPPPPAAD